MIMVHLIKGVDNMLEKILNKIGYSKLSKVEVKILYLMADLRVNKKDVFVDYVKKTNTQKFYVQKGKQKRCVLEV
jgi:hypothetical protein